MKNLLALIAALFRRASVEPVAKVEEPLPTPPAPAFPPLSAKDRDALIRTVYGEASGESEAGKIAVVHCIRNRLKRPKRFRATAEAVCTQPWQFSCWNAGDPNLARILALREASDVYGDLGALVDRAWQMDDTIGGADHYFADYVATPSWALPPAKMVKKIGVHQFYAGVA